MPLTRTVLAGPRTPGSGHELPRRVDVIGSLVPGRSPWTFETLVGGCSTSQVSGAEPPVARQVFAWRLGPGFGVTEGGCVLVGLALALARTPGAGDTGQTLIRRARLDAGVPVVVVPDLVTMARSLGEVPLSVLVTSVDDPGPLVAELDATTRWAVTSALVSR